jgi:hypothetical protein
VAFITGALQIAGVISLGLAHLLLFCAWFVVVVGVFTSEWLFSASKKQMFIVVSLTAAILGGLLYGVDIWMADKKAKIDKAITQKQLNSELKKEVARFVSSLYDFDQRMEAVKPTDLFYQQGEDYLAAKTEEEKRKVLQRYFEHEKQVRDKWDAQRKSEYNREYYTKAKNLRDEMLNLITLEKAGRRRTLMYENLAGPAPIRDIAADLEELSNLLPD